MRTQQQAGAAVKAGLSSLPAPEYTYEVAVPETATSVADADDADNGGAGGGSYRSGARDAADVAREQEQAQLREEQRQRDQMSTVRRRGLPQPSSALSSSSKHSLSQPSAGVAPEHREASGLINREMTLLVDSDAGAATAQPLPSTDEGYLQRAAQAVTDEMAAISGAEGQAEQASTYADFCRLHHLAQAQLESQRPAKLLLNRHAQLKASIKEQAQVAGALEGTISDARALYSARDGAASAALLQAHGEYALASRDLQNLSHLHACESGAAQRRLGGLQRELDGVLREEARLQVEYGRAMT